MISFIKYISLNWIYIKMCFEGYLQNGQRPVFRILKMFVHFLHTPHFDATLWVGLISKQVGANCSFNVHVTMLVM